MKKRVFIVHGWGGSPDEGWFPWLKRELEACGFAVSVPQLPDTKNPRIHTWVPALAAAVGAADKSTSAEATADEHTYFVGHSMGCQAIARYLATLPEDIAVGGAVFVAGFFNRLTGVRDKPRTRAIDREWLNTPIDFASIRSHLPKSIAIFSENDPVVPLDNQDDFCSKLGSEIIVLHAMGHFNGDGDNVFELPEARDAILQLARQSENA